MPRISLLLSVKESIIRGLNRKRLRGLAMRPPKKLSGGPKLKLKRSNTSHRTSRASSRKVCFRKRNLSKVLARRR
jgi:hypothetical protein